MFQDAGSAGRAHVLGADVVLDGQGDALQRRAHLATREGVGRFGGLLPSLLGGHRNVGVQLGPNGIDVLQHCLGQSHCIERAADQLLVENVYGLHA